MIRRCSLLIKLLIIGSALAGSLQISYSQIHTRQSAHGKLDKLHTLHTPGTKRLFNVALGVNVVSFGAVGDGQKDDTNAFVRAMAAMAAAGGGRVYIPSGNYKIDGNLNVPPSVTLQGIWAATPTGSGSWSAGSSPLKVHGSTLLAYAGRGEADGIPFLTLNRNSALKGVAIFYPKQTFPVPTPYPWCVRGNGDNCSLVDVLLVNPYQGVDFGTLPCGRHYINGLYGQPLRTGLFIDKCFDIGRVNNVHFWPFWVINKGLMQWTSEHGTAFEIGRTDWEYMMNCFCISYKVGYHFVQLKDGPGNVDLTQCGADEGADGTFNTPVIVDNCQGHAGISFVNSQFMGSAEMVVKPTNTGPVKFTACGFWGRPNCDTLAELYGTGNVTFDNCHFITWANINPSSPAIVADCDGLTITACDFMDPGKVQIAIGVKCHSAIVVANRLRGGIHIDNPTGLKAQIGLNSDH